MSRGTGMGVIKGCAIALALLLSGAALAAAPPELGGVWQGKIAVDAKTSLAVEFTFTKGANGAYTAVLNSPDNPDLKNTPVSAVSWDGSNLKLQVPSLSGAYAGTLKNGKIGGQWTQPGGALALELAPYQKPVVAASTIKTLVGSWTGALTVGGGSQNLTFAFKQAAGGGLEGTFQERVPIAPANIVFENGELSVKIPQAGIEYRGKLAGEQIAGKLKASNGQLPPDGVALNLKRGTPPPPAKAAPLKLSAEAFTALKGKWQGALEITNPQNNQKVQLPLAVRFEPGGSGEYFGYMDVPVQNLKDVPVTEVSFAAGKLMAKVGGAINGEFNGTLSGNSLTGEWTQGTVKLPLTLTR